MKITFWVQFFILRNLKLHKVNAKHHLGYMKYAVYTHWKLLFIISQLYLWYPSHCNLLKTNYSHTLLVPETQIWILTFHMPQTCLSIVWFKSINIIFCEIFFLFIYFLFLYWSRCYNCVKKAFRTRIFIMGFFPLIFFLIVFIGF